MHKFVKQIEAKDEAKDEAKEEAKDEEEKRERKKGSILKAKNVRLIMVSSVESKEREEEEE